MSRLNWQKYFLCVILRGEVWAPHRHTHYAQCGRPCLWGWARQQLGPWWQRPRWKVPHPTTKDHPDATPWLHTQDRAVNDNRVGGAMCYISTWSNWLGAWHALRDLEKDWGLWKVPEDAAMSRRWEFHEMEWDNIVPNTAFCSCGKRQRYREEQMAMIC